MIEIKARKDNIIVPDREDINFYIEMKRKLYHLKAVAASHNFKFDVFDTAVIEHIEDAKSYNDLIMNQCSLFCKLYKQRLLEMSCTFD